MDWRGSRWIFLACKVQLRRHPAHLRFHHEGPYSYGTWKISYGGVWCKRRRLRSFTKNRGMDRRYAHSVHDNINKKEANAHILCKKVKSSYRFILRRCSHLCKLRVHVFSLIDFKIARNIIKQIRNTTKHAHAVLWTYTNFIILESKPCHELPYELTRIVFSFTALS